MRILYYYYKDGRFAFSGEVKGLLGLDFVDNSFDSSQIDCFMDLGYLLEDNTWHKYIKLIKPATIMEFDINTKELTQKYYWKWSEIKPQNISFENVVDEFGELWLDAVRKRFNPNEKIGISLSGGLDSRAILAAVNKLYPDYKGYAFTFGKPECDDIKIAKQCIAKTKWQHKEFYFTNDNWFKPRKEKVWFTDGMLNMMHMHGSEFLNEVSINTDFVLSGYLGDVVCGASYIQSLDYLFNKRIDKNIAFIFYKNYASERWINDNFFDIDHVDPFLMMYRGRRFINMSTLNVLSYIGTRKPFFDNKLIEFIYSLPDEYRKTNKLYSAMLLKFFPEFFKEIPWQKTGKTIDKKIDSNFLSRTLRKVKRLPYKIGFLRDNHNYTNYKNWLKEREITKEITELLKKEKSQYQKYKDIDLYQNYFLPHLYGKKDYSEEILRAVTIELYLREYVYNKFKI